MDKSAKTWEEGAQVQDTCTRGVYEVSMGPRLERLPEDQRAGGVWSRGSRESAAPTTDPCGSQGEGAGHQEGP